MAAITPNILDFFNTVPKSHIYIKTGQIYRSKCRSFVESVKVAVLALNAQRLDFSPTACKHLQASRGKGAPDVH